MTPPAALRGSQELAPQGDGRLNNYGVILRCEPASASLEGWAANTSASYVRFKGEPQ
jgi:hypothetical protein